MRIILAVSIVIASIATASAQSTPDHVSTVDSSSSRSAAATNTGGSTATAPPVPGRSADFVVNGAQTIQAAPARTSEQRKADQAAQAAWQARCHPEVIEDREGMRRAHYAENDCDLSPFNTAGIR